MTDSPEMTLECHQCGVRSAWRDGFVGQTGVRHGPHHLCLTCAQYKQKYRDYYSSWFWWLTGAFIGGYLLTGDVVDSAVFVVLGYVITYLSVVVHELAHFGTAIAVGATVPVLSFGGGNRAKVFRLGGSFVIVSPTPLEGLIISLPNLRRHYRKKMAAIVAAGPLANLLLALAGAYVAMEMSDVLPDLLVAPLILMIAINALLFFGNLFLGENETKLGTQRSDGAQLVALPRMSDADIDEVLRTQNIVHALLELLYGDAGRSLALIEKELENKDENLAAAELASVLYTELGDFARGIELGRELLGKDDIEPFNRLLFQNNLAFTMFQSGDPELIDEAFELASEAFSALPMFLSVRSTYASLLIAKGRYQEGVDMLGDKRFRLESPKHQATVSSVRALGLAKLGQLEQAAEALDFAREKDPRNRQLTVAERQFSLAAGSVA